MTYPVHNNTWILIKVSVVIIALFSFATSASALTISPAKIEMNGDPGTTVSGQFLIMNEQGESMTFYTSAENFESQGETGVPSFKKENTGLASWITIDDSFSLNKGDQTIVPFSVSIPVNAEPGGYFSAIFLSTTPPDSKDGQVSVGAKIGVLVFMRVSGEMKEGGGVIEFDTADKGRFFSSLPIGLTYRFSNDGADRIKPEGYVSIRNIFGWKKTMFAVNPTQGNILPQSIRKFDVSWGNMEDSKINRNFFGNAWYQLKHFAFGVYRAEIRLENKNVSNQASPSLLLVVIPWQLILSVIVIGLVLFFGITRGIAKYNQWIISKAMARK